MTLQVRLCSTGQNRGSETRRPRPLGLRVYYRGLNPKALRIHILRLLGLKTILYKGLWAILSLRVIIITYTTLGVPHL